MTSISSELSVIRQTLREMESEPTATSASNAPGGSEPFAITLARATSEAPGSSAACDGFGPFVGLLSSASSTSPGLGASPLTLEGTGLRTSSSGNSEPSGVRVAHVVTSSMAPTSATSASGRDVVSVAEQFQGVPYLWGGTTPQGFDCSGFVQYVYARLGMDLPRTSEQQVTVGAPVASVADAKPGDLLFFAGSDGTANSPGHVGIYVGHGDMIDAPYTGTSVQVQPVSSAGDVVAIRRVLGAGA